MNKTEMESMLRKIWKEGYEAFGLVPFTMPEDVKSSFWKDQDGHDHIIFYDTNRDRDYIVKKIYYFYNIIFGEGNRCFVRSRLYKKKPTFNGRKYKGVDLMTLASFQLLINHLREEYTDMSLMSTMIGWLYEE